MDAMTPAQTKEAMQTAKRLFGDKFSLSDFASASGAPDTANVIVEYNPAGSKVMGVVQANASFTTFVQDSSIADMQRTFTVNARGQKIIHNDIFEAMTTGGGLGLKLFNRQVANAASLGFNAIETLAARSTGYNGYYTWARFGYNAKLSASVRGALPDSLKGARSMHELFRTESGRDWWRSMGDSMDMRFNLSPNSRATRHLKAYTEERTTRPAGSRKPASNPTDWEANLFTL